MYAAKLNTDKFKLAAEHIHTIVIPVGSVEAHGRHCPLETDNIIPERLCRDLEEIMNDKLFIAAPLAYGYTPSLAAFPGTVSLRMETLISLYSEIGLAYVKWGMKNIVFMNGHGGNIPALSASCDNLAAAGANAMVVSYWLNYSQDILTICSGQGHAGEDETSLVLALDPDMVDMTRATAWEKKPLIHPMNGPTLTIVRFPDAVTGDARKASADKGARMYKLICQRNVEIIRAFMAGQYVK